MALTTAEQATFYNLLRSLAGDQSALNTLFSLTDGTTPPLGVNQRQKMYDLLRSLAGDQTSLNNLFSTADAATPPLSTAQRANMDTLLLALAGNPAALDALSFGGGRPAVLGQLATRCSIPSQRANLFTPVMCRTFHYARDNISQVQVAWPNRYSQDETSSGGTVTVTASVEYPAGTFNQLQFSGSTSGSTSGQLLLSDVATLSTPIPNGAKFWVRFYIQYSGGLIYMQTGNYYFPAGGDASHTASATDQTMGGTVVDEASGIALYPCAIIGMTAKRTLFIDGDSRSAGSSDTADANGDTGELCRPLGSSYAYINVSISGSSASHWAANHSMRAALAAYCNTAIENLGINDLGSGQTLAQIQASITGMRTDLAALEFWACTISPRTTGAWTLADGSDQTPTVSAATRQLLNTWIRGLGDGSFTGYLEIANQMQLAANADKWNADGTPAKYTADGLHGTPFAMKALALTLP